MASCHAGWGPVFLGISDGADTGSPRSPGPRGGRTGPGMRAERKRERERPVWEAGPAAPTPNTPSRARSLGPVSRSPRTSHPLSLAGEPTFRCDACDELFQSKLDLRRHKKYACGSVGATLYEGLGEELKPEGLGGGGGEQAHECKDCERMFPNKYRCGCPPSPQASSLPPAPPLSSPHPLTAPQAPQAGQQSQLTLGPQLGPRPSALSTLTSRESLRDGGDQRPLRCGSPRGRYPSLPTHLSLHTAWPMSWWLQATGAPGSDPCPVPPPPPEDLRGR